MKFHPCLHVWLPAVLVCTSLLHADDSSVFRFKGSNSTQTIEGTIVLNRGAPRSQTGPDFAFSSPVEALTYKVTEGASVVGHFKFTAANPNSLVITKGPGGATAFRFQVEPVPSNPPFPGPPAFVMEFSYPGAAPWGDWIPERTIAGANNVQLGANDTFLQSVSIMELNRELSGIEAELRKLESGLGAQFKNSAFVLPGTTPSERVAAVVMGFEDLSSGPRKQSYNFWLGKP